MHKTENLFEQRAKEEFQSFLDNIGIYETKGMQDDGKTLANVILTKYAGDETVEVLKYIYANLYKRNKFITSCINVKETKLDDIDH